MPETGEEESPEGNSMRTGSKTKPTEKQIFEELPVARSLRIMVVPAVISQLIVLIYNRRCESFSVNT